MFLDVPQTYLSHMIGCLKISSLKETFLQRKTPAGTSFVEFVNEDKGNFVVI